MKKTIDELKEFYGIKDDDRIRIDNGIYIVDDNFLISVNDEEQMVELSELINYSYELIGSKC